MQDGGVCRGPCLLLPSVTMIPSLMISLPVALPSLSHTTCAISLSPGDRASESIGSPVKTVDELRVLQNGYGKTLEADQTSFRIYGGHRA